MLALPEMEAQKNTFFLNGEGEEEFWKYRAVCHNIYGTWKENLIAVSEKLGKLTAVFVGGWCKEQSF